MHHRNSRQPAGPAGTRLTWRHTGVTVAVLLALASGAQAAVRDEATLRAIDHATQLLAPGQAAARSINASPADSFVLRAAADAGVADVAGERHLRFDRRHQGVPVLGGDLIVHLSAQGRLERVTASLRQPLNLGVVPAVASHTAEALALADFGQAGDAHKAVSELQIIAVPAVSAEPFLAWVVSVDGARCSSPSVMRYYVDALTGQIRSRHESLPSLAVRSCDARGGESHSLAVPPKRRGSGVDPMAAATGTGKSLYYGSLSVNTDKLSDTNYEMRDTTRGNHYVTDFSVGYVTPMSDADNVWGDGTTADRATVAVDAAYGQRMTWDYFKSLGRNGIANDGVGYSSTVHFQKYVGVDEDNAYWDGSRMKYGDGLTMFKPLVSLDIAGHEMSHGVNQHAANLVYANESGGLNEANSDIFGAMVEYYANNTKDKPDYKIGELVMKTAGTALRHMYQPSLDGASFDCWYSGTSGLDPHYSSGIGNHFYYLLAEGSQAKNMPVSPVCMDSDAASASDSLKVTGIGRAKAQKIWYHALTNNMVATSTFAQAREATLASTKTLHGDDSGEYRAVDFAWLAVNVTDKPKATSFTNNLTWQYAQILTPSPELVLMGRPAAKGVTHWYSLYLDVGKTIEANLVAADATTNFNLVVYDSDHTTVLKNSKNAGGAKETATYTNSTSAMKFIYIAVPYSGGKAPYTLRLKLY